MLIVLKLSNKVCSTSNSALIISINCLHDIVTKFEISKNIAIYIYRNVDRYIYRYVDSCTNYMQVMVLLWNHIVY